VNVSSDFERARARLVEENEIPFLPSGWDVRRFRFLFRESSERNGDAPIGEMLSVSEYRGVVPKQYEYDEQKRTEEELTNYRVVRPGQLAVNSMWLNHLGLGVSDHLGHVSPAYAVYDIDPTLNERYVHHLLRSQYYLKIYLRYLYGIRPNSFQIKSDDWNSIPVIVPPRETQKAIADFLDRETARIDQLVEKKQRLVDLIVEKRAVETDKIVFGPVDGGLVPSSKIKFLAKRISKGTTPSTLGAEMVAAGVRFLRAENIWFGAITDSPQHFISDETHQMMARSALKPKDVLVVIAGATTGKTAVVQEGQTPANTNQAISHIRLWRPCLAPVISAAIQTTRVQQEILLTSVQSAQPNLAMEDLGNLKVPAPNKDVAFAMIKRLEGADAKYRSLTDSVSQSADKLREFRMSLITAAITGQIDVTTWSRQGQTDRSLDEIEEAHA
jgi:type I restriction enzyme, S subunit